MDEAQMWLSQIRLIQLTVENALYGPAWFAFLIFLASEPVFDRILCGKVPFFAAITPVFVNANAEAVTCAPRRVFLDRLQAQGFEVRLEFGVTFQDLGG